MNCVNGTPSTERRDFRVLGVRVKLCSGLLMLMERWFSWLASLFANLGEENSSASIESMPNLGVKPVLNWKVVPGVQGDLGTCPLDELFWF